MKQISLACLLVFLVSTSLKAEHWSTGYYQVTGDNPVFYYNDENRWYCQVQNQSQLENFNEVDQVRIVGDVWSFLSQATSLGSCAWNNGFYTTAADSTIYRLYPGNVCIISTPEMLAAYGATDSVTVADDGSDFTAHRNNIGQCYWPSWDLANLQQDPK